MRKLRCGLLGLLCLTPWAALAQAPFTTAVVADFNQPWSLALLPDGRLLVTETQGKLLLVSREGGKSLPVTGVPDVDYGGQGGLGDVVLHPDFERNALVYLSYAEAGAGGATRGAAVARARLDAGARRPQLTDLEVIWRQYPNSWAVATTVTGCCSTTRVTSGSPPAIARNLPRLRICRRMWASCCA